MTKVIFSPLMLDYQQMMAGAVEQVRRMMNITGLQPCTHQMPYHARPDAISSEPGLAGLLQPPGIGMCADIDARDGQLNVLVQVWTWGDYGFHSVFMTILDAQGDVIDSDYAIRGETFLNFWAYIFEFEDEDDRSLTIQVMAMDYLGGIRIQTETVPI